MGITFPMSLYGNKRRKDDKKGIQQSLTYDLCVIKWNEKGRLRLPNSFPKEWRFSFDVCHKRFSKANCLR